jgi:hypothetical protein
VAFHCRLDETQVQDVELALPLVKADAFTQLKHEYVLPESIIAELVPQSQNPLKFQDKAVELQVQLLLLALIIFVAVYVPVVPHVKQPPFDNKTTLAELLHETHEFVCQILLAEHMQPPLPSPDVPVGQAVQIVPDR